MSPGECQVFNSHGSSSFPYTTGSLTWLHFGITEGVLKNIKAWLPTPEIWFSCGPTSLVESRP